MDVVVCLKQVPETTSVRIDPQKGTLIREGIKGVMNPFDVYALEEGLRIKERVSGKVFCISMGPPQAKDMLKEAISLGADEAFLLTDKNFAGADTQATSLALSVAIKKLFNFDLIICGRQAIDGDTGQVGPELADKLGIPHITYVRKIVSISSDKIVCERLLDDGYETIESSMPALITVVKEINEPRVPSVRGMMRAKRYKVKELSASDLEIDKTLVGLLGSPTRVVKTFQAKIRRETVFLSGTPDEIASSLLEKLKEFSLI